MDGPSQTITTYTNYPTASISPPINVYRVKDDENTIGWIILSFILASVIIALLILWVFCLWNDTNTPPCSCFGLYGVELNVDANALIQCGTNRNQTCTFRKNSLSDCVNQCDSLSNICQAFTFNANTSTMKIVQPTNTFVSPQTNLFVRQSGTIS